jgi:hypothetical protein
MTMNSRPVDDPRLQKALDEIKQVYARYGFAGAAMVIGPQEGAFFYAMHAPWSAIRYDRDAPLGWRLRAIQAEEGRAKTEARIEGAVHTVCQLSDFGFQTQEWMEQVKAMIRRAGINFEHTSFGGRPLPPLGTVNMLKDPPEEIAP